MEWPKLKDETNLNSFKYALTLSGTGAGVAIVLIELKLRLIFVQLTGEQFLLVFAI